MKDQVTSIEQSKRLIEMGVPAEKASMFIVGDVGVYPRFYVEAHPNLRRVPTFTVADLLGMMPKDIPAAGEQNHDYSLTLSYSFCWKICYEDNRTHLRIGEQLDFDLVDLLVDRIEWLLSNGYKLEK